MLASAKKIQKTISTNLSTYGINKYLKIVEPSTYNLLR